MEAGLKGGGEVNIIKETNKITIHRIQIQKLRWTVGAFTPGVEQQVTPTDYRHSVPPPSTISTSTISGRRLGVMRRLRKRLGSWG